MLTDDIKHILRVIKEKNLYPRIRVVEGISSEPEIIVEGKRVLQFCSGNYLGLANHPEIKKAVKEGLDKYGLHPAGSRLISGTLDIHVKLEKKTASFKNGEACMIFTTGAMANMGAIPSIVNLPNYPSYSTVIKNILREREVAIFSDELNHATIY